MNFVVPADHRVKIKEIWKRDKYLNLARELESNGIVIGALETALKGLKQSPKSWKRVWKSWKS